MERIVEWIWDMLENHWRLSIIISVLPVLGLFFLGYSKIFDAAILGYTGGSAASILIALVIKGFYK